MAMAFDAFDTHLIDVGETTLFARRGGVGPPLLLLHGFPETHVMWHRVAPALASAFSVVCADLRGYGGSGTPSSSDDHATYSKRRMADDMVRLMASFGFERFAVVGHDRGGRVAYRMALDHPPRISRLAVLDIVPTSEAFRHADARFALAYWPWSLLAQPQPLPERLIAAEPEAIVDAALATWGTDAASVPADIRRAYVDALRDEAHVHAICEEYRAAATLDVAHDAEDRAAGRRIECPVLALWSSDGPLDLWYREGGGPLAIWRAWAEDVTGRSIAGGHFFPEANPVDTVDALRSFLQS
jgi:haloacetate dehalogenase